MALTRQADATETGDEEVSKTKVLVQIDDASGVLHEQGVPFLQYFKNGVQSCSSQGRHFPQSKQLISMRRAGASRVRIGGPPGPCHAWFGKRPLLAGELRVFPERLRC